MRFDTAGAKLKRERQRAFHRDYSKSPPSAPARCSARAIWLPSSREGLSLSLYQRTKIADSNFLGIEKFIIRFLSI